MKKGARKALRRAVKSSAHFGLQNQIKKEIDLMHQATAEFIDVCIDIAKAHPRGLSRIKDNVERIASNMFKLDKIYAGKGK